MVARADKPLPGIDRVAGMSLSYAAPLLHPGRSLGAKARAMATPRHQSHASQRDGLLWRPDIMVSFIVYLRG